MSKLEIHQYKYMSDNYGVLVHSSDTGQTTCIDSGDADATLAALNDTGWTLTDIWVTHHHADHTDGVMALKRATGATVTGPEPLSSPIAGVDIALKDEDVFTFAGLEVRAIHTPGHTKDMINYYIADENIVFTGDTLFTMGCGRLFECDANTMHESLAKLIALPIDTLVYSAHEYTLANANFALSVDPENSDLQARCKIVEALITQGKATVPSSLREELATNPFLRADNPAIRAVLNMSDASDAAVFAEIRQRKDNF